MGERCTFEREIRDLDLVEQQFMFESPLSTHALDSIIWGDEEYEWPKSGTFISVEELEKKYPLKDESLHKFRSMVYIAQIKLSQKNGRKFVKSLSDEDISIVEKVKIHKSASQPLRDLLNAARNEIEHQGKQIKVKAGNAYRSADWQFNKWATERFPQYYKQATTETIDKKTGSKKRPLIAPGDFSEAAADKLAKYISGKFAAPGFSNHQDGLAVDFHTKQSFGGKPVKLTAKFTQRSLWWKSWFWNWLEKEKNAYKFGFAPYKKEPWHWEYRPEIKVQLADSRPHVQARTGEENRYFVMTDRSIPTGFSGGQVWTFLARIPSIQVAVFCPKAASSSSDVEMLVYLHGLLKPCPPVPKGPADLITKEPFELGKIVDASNRKIILVVPFMAWEKTGKRHPLSDPAKLNRLIDDILNEVGRVRGASIPSLRGLVLAGHSKAYVFLNKLAKAHADPEMSRGALAKLSQVWAFDTTYSSPIDDYSAWLNSNPNLIFHMFYRKGSKTEPHAQKFFKLVKRNVGRFNVKDVPECHCSVPVKRLPDLLVSSMSQFGNSSVQK